MFTGFTPEAIDFLWGIRMNNSRDWFLPRKDSYVRCLYQPMKDLAEAVFQPFLDCPGELLKVSRIYRDARLHHPDPYKDTLWFSIRRPGEQWSECPCLFFELSPEGAGFGFSLWRPKAAAMAAFRRELTANPREFLELAEQVREATGIPVTGERYKQPKKTDNQDLVPYISWKQDIGCVEVLAPGPQLFSPELAERVSAQFRALYPLYQYFNRFRP